MSIFGILGLILIILKLFDLITWTWVWVLAPFWGSLLLNLLFYGVILKTIEIMEKAKKL